MVDQYSKEERKDKDGSIILSAESPFVVTSDINNPGDYVFHAGDFDFSANRGGLEELAEGTDEEIRSIVGLRSDVMLAEMHNKGYSLKGLRQAAAGAIKHEKVDYAVYLLKQKSD
jgi:hypothetical protein